MTRLRHFKILSNVLKTRIKWEKKSAYSFLTLHESQDNKKRKRAMSRASSDT